MKQLTEQLNKLPSLVYIILAVVLAILLSALVVMMMILPAFDELNQISQEVKTEKLKVDEIKKTLAFLEAQNKKTLTEYSQFFDQLIPGQLDMLHFASLNEVVAAAAGAAVEDITITKGAAPSTATGQTTPPTSPAPATGTSAPPTAATTPLVQAAPTTVSVTYNSNYDSLLLLIDFWTKADQLVGVSLVKTSGQSEGVLSYTIEYTLPVSGAKAAAILGESIQFSQAEKDKIDKLIKRVVYFATPSAQPVGKNNPFQ